MCGVVCSGEGDRVEMMDQCSGPVHRPPRNDKGDYTSLFDKRVLIKARSSRLLTS